MNYSSSGPVTLGSDVRIRLVPGEVISPATEFEDGDFGTAIRAMVRRLNRLHGEGKLP